jgi:hypothetical protein
MRKNLDLAYIDDYAALRPGEVAFGTDKMPYTSSGSLARLFDDQKTDPGWRGIMRPANATKGTERPEKEKPLSWMPIVMRLPNGAGEIKSYDIVHYQASTHVRSFASYFVDGSVDGIHWDRLSTVDSVGEVGANDWEFHGTDFEKGGERNKEHSGGCEIASAPAKPFDVLNNVKSVSVNSGAELVFEGDIVIPALSYDCEAGGGTFSGCKFAENGGFVDIVNVPDGETKIDFGWTFNGCSGVENIKGWSLKLNGEETSRYSLSIERGSKIVAVRTGLRVIVR